MGVIPKSVLDSGKSLGRPLDAFFFAGDRAERGRDAFLRLCPYSDIEVKPAAGQQPDVQADRNTDEMEALVQPARHRIDGRMKIRVFYPTFQAGPRVQVHPGRDAQRHGQVVTVSVRRRFRVELIRHSA